MKREELRALSGLTSIGIALLLCASAAHAVDGVIEINHASIIAAGGYPAKIVVAGSYVLTGNLTAAPGSDAIDVNVADVTLDLNGFEVRGSGVATGINGAFPALTVRNGSVTGFSTGIASGAGKVIQVHVVSNSGTGILGSGGCQILESTVVGNGNGIQTDRCKISGNLIEGNGIGIRGMSNLIEHNSLMNNGGGGISSPGGSTIQSNLLVDNGAFGISDGLLGPPPVPPPPGPPQRNQIIGNTIQGTFLGPGISLRFPAQITDNLISANATDGIFCGAACTVNGNTIESNNFTFAAASGGVTVAPGSNVSENVISFNFNFGLMLPVTSAYRGDTFMANAGPDVIPGLHPTRGFQNICSGVVPCP